MLPKEAIKEFREIYKEEYGVELSDEEATEKSLAVINFMKIITTQQGY